MSVLEVMYSHLFTLIFSKVSLICVIYFVIFSVDLNYNLFCLFHDFYPFKNFWFSHYIKFYNNNNNNL